MPRAYTVCSLGLTSGLWGQWYDCPHLADKEMEWEGSAACPWPHRQEALRLRWMKPGIMGPQPVLSTTYGTPLQSKPLGHQMPSLSVSLYLCLFIESSWLSREAVLKWLFWGRGHGGSEKGCALPVILQFLSSKSEFKPRPSDPKPLLSRCAKCLVMKARRFLLELSGTTTEAHSSSYAHSLWPPSEGLLLIWGGVHFLFAFQF